MFLLSPAENCNGVVHLRSRRFSARACSKGMGASPEAFASSIARMSSRSSRSSRSFSYSSTLMTTAILSPFSFVRNWVGRFISSPHQSLAQPQTGSKKGDIDGKPIRKPSHELSHRSVVVGRGGHFEDGKKRFLGDINLTDALHAALAFFLLFEEFAFARNVSAVALGENVFADGRHGFARDDAAADGRLDGYFKHLARNQLTQARDQFAAAFRSEIAMDDQRQRVHRFAGNEHIQLNQVGFAVPGEMVVERSVAA